MIVVELEIELADNIFSDSQDQQIESLKYLDILSNVAVEHDEVFSFEYRTTESISEHCG